MDTGNWVCCFQVCLDTGKWSFHFCAAGDWTQGLTHARQAFYRWGTHPAQSPLETGHNPFYTSRRERRSPLSSDQDCRWWGSCQAPPLTRIEFNFHTKLPAHNQDTVLRQTRLSLKPWLHILVTLIRPWCYKGYFPQLVRGNAEQAVSAVLIFSSHPCGNIRHRSAPFNLHLPELQALTFLSSDSYFTRWLAWLVWISSHQIGLIKLPHLGKWPSINMTSLFPPTHGLIGNIPL